MSSYPTSALETHFEEQIYTHLQSLGISWYVLLVAMDDQNAMLRIV